jgi:DNA-directed RNA polymerase specialized sigma subunit
VTPSARRLLIERHLPLVRSIARRYAGGGEPLEDLAQVGALGAALRSLAPTERRVVQLRFVEDLSQAQIARRIGLSQVHVSRTLRAALLRLHEQLAVSG